MNGTLKLAAATTLIVSAASSAPLTAAPPIPMTDPAARCEALSKLSLPGTKVVDAKFVAAKPATGKDDGHRAFCRVVARVQSAPGSDIGIEIWLPAEGWTGVFHGNGNGGFAGVLSSGYAGMAAGLRRGFATATTDAGTAPASPLDGEALFDQPRKWRDWGRLSTHVMTVTGKAITRAFYGDDPTRAYYTGCSTGGQQGLIEALHYPADYDGILVGAPVINRTWGHAAVLWNYAAAHRAPDSLLTDAKLGLLNRAAVAACGRLGGGLATDPFIADPLSCRFDPEELLCRGAASEGCLTMNEVATARVFYSGPTGRDGRPRFFGWLPGSEAPGRYGWSFLQTAINDLPPFSSLLRWVFGAAWDWRGFDVDRDMARVDATIGPVVNDALLGNLRRFRARGGKLIVYHGLADSLVPPGQTVAFYDRHARSLGGVSKARGFARMFLAPGMMHCGGGAGPDSFNSAIGAAPAPPEADPDHDLFSALIDWRERGRGPDRVIATKFTAAGSRRVEMQRPLCAYPMRAIYRGHGSTTSAASFACVGKQAR